MEVCIKYIMVRLLKCLGDVCRWKGAVSVMNGMMMPSRILNRSCANEIHTVSSLLRKSRSEGVLGSLSGCSLRGQPLCFPGCQIGFQLQDVCGFQVVNTASFHTSSYRNGRVDDFMKRHQQGLREAPIPALTLGVTGLIPFVAPAVYTAVTCTVGPSILWAQAAYGASILSFLGGTRWGFALIDRQGVGPAWSTLGYSVLPSLIAWLGLLMPLQASQVCVMSGLLMAWAADMTVKAYPAWFRSLRLVLSLFALLSLGVSYGFSLVYEPTSEKHGSNIVKLIKIVQIILED